MKMTLVKSLESFDTTPNGDTIEEITTGIDSIRDNVEKESQLFDKVTASAESLLDLTSTLFSLKNVSLESAEMFDNAFNNLLKATPSMEKYFDQDDSISMEDMDDDKSKKNKFVEFFKKIWKFISDTAKRVFNAIKNFFKLIFGVTLRNEVKYQKACNEYKNKINEFYKKYQEKVDHVKDLLLEDDGLKDGISSNLNKVYLFINPNSLDDLASLKMINFNLSNVLLNFNSFKLGDLVENTFKALEDNFKVNKVDGYYEILRDNILTHLKKTRITTYTNENLDYVAYQTKNKEKIDSNNERIYGLEQLSSVMNDGNLGRIIVHDDADNKNFLLKSVYINGGTLSDAVTKNAKYDNSVEKEFSDMADNFIAAFADYKSEDYKKFNEIISDSIKEAEYFSKSTKDSPEAIEKKLTKDMAMVNNLKIEDQNQEVITAYTKNVTNLIKSINVLLNLGGNYIKAMNNLIDGFSNILVLITVAIEKVKIQLETEEAVDDTQESLTV